MIKRGIAAYKGKRVLFLQGPVGPFFTRLGRALEQVGATVYKIDFNGGDWLYSPRNSIAFRGRPEEWPAFLEKVLVELRIDVVSLFGDCRPMHRVAHEVADRLGLEIGVYEEGYIRPDYITLEKHGVNGHSRIPRTPVFYLSTPVSDLAPRISVGNTFWYAAWWAVSYYLAASLLRPLFRHYRHHRPLTVLEAWPWARSVFRKARYAIKERRVQSELSTTLAGRYFLVPLQVHNDAQVNVHSRFPSVDAFIGHVVMSFAAHAPKDTTLVVKHHPMDRGYHDYTRLIKRLASAHGIQDRVRYIHDQHLPSLLSHARGVVVINSTVGMSALDHGTPLKVCGDAIYDMEGLTYQGGLDDFWNDAAGHSVNQELLVRFQNYLIENTQLNGSFYKRLDVPQARGGVVRPVVLRKYETVVPASEEQSGIVSSRVPGGAVYRAANN
jgi:capsular polysaccharide export protein